MTNYKIHAVLFAAAGVVICSLVACAANPSTSGLPTPKNGQFSVAKPTDQSTPAQLLVGRWRHTEMLRIVNGKVLAVQPAVGESISEFDSKTWMLKGPGYRSTGTYRWVDRDHIETTTIDSDLKIQIGWVSIKRVSVDTDKLELEIRQTAAEYAKILPSVPGQSSPVDAIIVTRAARVGS